MPRFAANLTMLFTEIPLLDRIRAAKAAGFNQVEILFPYDLPENASLETLRAILDAEHCQLVLINTPPGNWQAGERGFAACPAKVSAFRRGLDQAADTAEVLGAHFIHVMSGVAQGAEARACLIENLLWATSRYPDQMFTIEPINPHDMPGYFLNDFDLAAEVLDQVNAPNLALQFDSYHAHRITSDALSCWDKHGWRAAHIQIAGYPGRHEPTQGDIDYAAFLARLDNDGFQGVVAGEYNPVGRTEDGLAWAIRT